jgi:alpha-beta hydrolase superfamily lysophospholipase
MHSRYLAFWPHELQPDPATKPESTWWSWRGNHIHIERVRRPRAQARMILIHGGGGHAALLWPIAAAAADRGFEVMTPDLPGFGKTRVQNVRRLRYSDWVKCLTDLTLAEAAADARPLVLFGGSMGGMLAYEAAARTNVSAAVIATCLLDLRRTEVRAVIARNALLGRLGPRLLFPALDRIRIPLRLIGNLAAMSNDPELNRVAATDPRGAGVSMPLGFWRTYLQSRPHVEPEHFTVCPIWLAHPGADRWTPLPLSQVFFDRIASPKTLVSLDNAGHCPIETPGAHQLVELLSQVRARVVAPATTG